MNDPATVDPPRRVAARLARLAKKLRLKSVFAIALPCFVVLAGVATYWALTGAPPVGDNPERLRLLLYLDCVLLLVLAIVVVRRIAKIWLARRRGSAGSRLHLRLVVLFGLVAVTPTIIVMSFSVLFFDFGIQSWFSERVGAALEEAQAVAIGYEKEHQENIRSDVLRMARDMNRDAPLLESNLRLLNQAVRLQAQLRGLTEAVVFDGSGRVLARSGLTYALEFETVQASRMETARSGEVPVWVNDSDDRVRALVRLDNFLDAYLYVGRFVDATVLSHTERTRNAVEEFYSLKEKSSGFLISFTLIFTLVALLLVTASVWLGLYVATDFTQPVSELIGAVEKVRGGDLSARVKEPSPNDEIGGLSRAFNRMADQLESQRRELTEANRQIDERRQFTETVLSGVSAGVIGLDSSGRINLPNRSAARLLGMDIDEMAGRHLADIVPEMAGLLREARRRRKSTEAQIKISRKGKNLTLLVAIASEYIDSKLIGFVITFDDVSELLEAQWKGAWADVARRIAHEIRNPLTPIQLAAERLKKKYLKEIKSDPETFEICTDTIIRQVDDIGRMIEEFSNFARMPAPILRLENLSDLCRQAVFLQRTAHSAIEFETEMPDEQIFVTCDGRQISQAVTNILQNAADSMERRRGGASEPARIELRLNRGNDGVTRIEVEDNGPGWPKGGRDQLTEPYVTTRAKGTGLGLAIVKKIMEDHGGNLVLDDSRTGGALVRLELSDSVADSQKDAAE